MNRKAAPSRSVPSGIPALDELARGIRLGVNVGYGDTDSAAVIVELAREGRGHVPEVSCGTRFIQDLVESLILYFPVYPNDPAGAFNEAFLRAASNHLA